MPHAWFVQVGVAGAVAGQALAAQQWEAVPGPPEVQTSTQFPVDDSHVRLAPHVTPVHFAMHEPVAGSHLSPDPQLTPVQFATHEPVPVSHF